MLLQFNIIIIYFLFAVSILSFLFIALLVVSEFWYYRGVETKYKYEVDTDTERYKL